MARSRRDPAARRAELVAAAKRLFADRGLDETAVSDIVAAAGVAQRPGRDTIQPREGDDGGGDRHGC